MIPCANPKCTKQITPKSRVHKFCSDACRKADRHGKEWEKVRTDCLERAGYACEECSASGCRLEAHHVVPVCMGGAILDPNNLIIYCVPCHKAVHATWQQWLAYDGDDLADGAEATEPQRS
jgi:5-methylcytosine-specific restriction endonuclease McrA